MLLGCAALPDSWAILRITDFRKKLFDSNILTVNMQDNVIGVNMQKYVIFTGKNYYYQKKFLNRCFYYIIFFIEGPCVG